VSISLWAIEENIPQSSLRKLLTILRQESDISSFNKLHKVPRTLLQTPRNIGVKEVYPGQFYYFGIALSINKYFKQFN
ncbi:hypothetical protein NQ314_008449, partial [Rhamnusium bicolor]